MRLLRASIAVVLLAVVMVACGDQTTPTALNDEALAPWFNFTNGPANPGKSIVMRGAEPAFFIGTDPARDLVSVNGLGTLDPAQSVVCGGQETFDIIEFTDAFTSGGIIDNAVWQNPTQHIYAGLVNFFNQTSLCDALSLSRVAEGIGDHFRYNDTCFFNSCDKRTRSVGWRAQGTLDDLMNGGETRYTEEQRGVLRPPYNLDDIRFLMENIRLHHIGK